ncbi:MAG: hypothetical protein ACLFVK_06640 [Dehalococcoidia bacterium]
MMAADTIRECVAKYWRFRRQCFLVAFEATDTSFPGLDNRRADILTADDSRRLIEIEVKVSMSDLHRDYNKWLHNQARWGHPTLTVAYFYFAVPRPIANQVCLVCDQKFPYAGVLGCNGLDEYGVSVYRKPKQLSDKRLSVRKIYQLVKAQSGTICHLAGQLEEQKRVVQNLRGGKP